MYAAKQMFTLPTLPASRCSFTTPIFVEPGAWKINGSTRIRTMAAIPLPAKHSSWWTVFSGCLLRHLAVTTTQFVTCTFDPWPAYRWIVSHCPYCWMLWKMTHPTQASLWHWAHNGITVIRMQWMKMEICILVWTNRWRWAVGTRQMEWPPITRTPLGYWPATRQLYSLSVGLKWFGINREKKSYGCYHVDFRYYL